MRDYSALEKTGRERDPDFRKYPPIDDLLLTLHLLQCGWNDRTMRRLMTPLALTPYIEIMICNGGYTREEHSGSEYYPVADEVVRELRLKRYVEGRKHMGYTDEHECAISEYGDRACQNMEKEFAVHAKEFLARMHPDILCVQNTVSPRLHTMRYGRNFSDFFIGMEINEMRDEVRRTRGVFSLVRRVTQKR